uniref:Uncharacterized protein n=1 Tax=Micrurus lemniscatus lemniscatus TaxID=129467 RepID=A0A2D4IQR7_MICLE
MSALEKNSKRSPQVTTVMEAGSNIAATPVSRELSFLSLRWVLVGGLRKQSKPPWRGGEVKEGCLARFQGRLNSPVKLQGYCPLCHVTEKAAKMAATQPETA